MDQIVRPVVRPVRKISHAIKDNLWSVLDNMDCQVIVAAVAEPTEWVSGIVMVLDISPHLKHPMDTTNTLGYQCG